MPIDFPDNPTSGDTFTSNGKTWEFDGASWSAKMATSSVASGSITVDKLADGAVHTAKVADDAVTTAKIAAGAITATELGTGAVTAGKIDALAVTSGKLAADSVTEAKIAASAVSEAKIAAGAVSEAKLASNAVTAGKIASNVITQDKLASGLSVITVCTSSTRPASPFEGQMIYETDTDLQRVYQGSQWVRIVALDTVNRFALPASGTVVTEAATGRGLGIAASSGDASAILQFTNNAIGAQWATLVATGPGTLTMNADTAINTNIPIQNSVAQVIHTIYSSGYSRTNTVGRADITGWTMSITPKKAGNKIIILVQAALMAICDGYLYLKKNGTEIANPLISVPRVDFSNDDATFYGQYVDTAASTSAITYQFAAQATGCQGFFGVNSQGGVSSTIMIEVQS